MACASSHPTRISLLWHSPMSEARLSLRAISISTCCRPSRPCAPTIAAQKSRRSDEVILGFHGLDVDFEQIVRRYAGAEPCRQNRLATEMPMETRPTATYAILNRWLRRNFNAYLRVTYRGITRSVPEVLATTRSSASQDPGELIQLMASHLLAPHFEDVYPDYPAFAQLPRDISEDARNVSAMDAVQFIARSRSKTLWRASVSNSVPTICAGNSGSPSPDAGHSSTSGVMTPVSLLRALAGRGPSDPDGCWMITSVAG